MAGFLPVGSFPVASVPTGQAGIIYLIDPGYAQFSGSLYTFTYTFPQVRTSWVGLEVLNTTVSDVRVSWMGVEVLASTALGDVEARVSWIGIEVLRSVGEQEVTDFGFVSIIW